MESIEGAVWSNDPFIQKEMEFFMSFELEDKKPLKKEKKYSDNYFINKEINFYMSFEN